MRGEIEDLKGFIRYVACNDELMSDGIETHVVLHDAEKAICCYFTERMDGPGSDWMSSFTLSLLNIRDKTPADLLTLVRRHSGKCLSELRYVREERRCAAK